MSLVTSVRKRAISRFAGYSHTTKNIISSSSCLCNHEKKNVTTTMIHPNSNAAGGGSSSIIGNDWNQSQDNKLSSSSRKHQWNKPYTNYHMTFATKAGNEEDKKKEDEWLLENDILSILDSYDDDDDDKLDDNHDNNSSSSGDDTTIRNQTMMEEKDSITIVKRTRQRRMRRRTKNKSPVKKPTPMTMPPLPMQTRRNAELLFDALAPHLEFDDLHMIESKIQKLHKLLIRKGGSSSNNKNKKRKNEPKNYLSHEYVAFAVDKIHKMCASSSTTNTKRKNSKKNATNNNTTNDTLKTNAWIKSLLLQFFVGNNNRPIPKNEDEQGGLFHSNIVTAPPISQTTVYGDPTFTPNSNRATYKQNVSILMKAREVSMESSPLLWSNKQKKQRMMMKKSNETKSLQEDNNVHVDSLTDSNNDNDDDANPFDHAETTRDAHYSKSPEILRYEAELMASILADRLPRTFHNNLMNLFEKYANDRNQEIIQQQNKDKVSLSEKNVVADNSEINDNNNNNNEDSQSMEMLYVNLERCTQTHVHLIATDVANFFYVDVPEVLRTEGGAAEAVTTSIATENANTSHINTDLHDVHSPDPRLNEVWKKWNHIRDEFAQIFLSSQHTFANLHHAKLKEETLRNKSNDDESSSGEDGDNDQVGKKKNDIHETLRELDILRTRADNKTRVGRDRPLDGRKGRRTKGIHVEFSAALLNDKFGPFSHPSTAAAFDEDLLSSYNSDLKIPETDRIIFINNLPIDITKEEITDIYSRCGPIESVEIFNLRPDLDPGKLSGGKLLEKRRKKRRSGGSMADFRKVGGKERTPVYGAIKFSSSVGYDTATIDALRIFGMVVRFHPIRTIRARDVTSLFIENIPSGQLSIDIEHQISKVLHPDIYVCVDLGVNDYAVLNSCEIKFPTFEVANHAYSLLQNVDFGNDECTLNWMRTRENAMGYWTRELGFDP